MSMSSYESAFQNRTLKKLAELSEKKLNNMAQGGCARDDASATGAAYNREVGYLQALRDVAELMQEVESELLGRQRE